MAGRSTPERGACDPPACVATTSAVGRHAPVRSGVGVGIGDEAAAADPVPQLAGAVGAADRLADLLALDGHRGAVGQAADLGVAGARARAHVEVDAAGGVDGAGDAAATAAAVLAGVGLLGVVRDLRTVPLDLLHHAVVALLEVQVGRQVVLGAGAADSADLLAALDRLALGHRTRVQVRVQRLPAVAVADDDVVAVAGGRGIGRRGDGAAVGRDHGVAEVGVGLGPAVEVDGIGGTVPVPGAADPLLAARERHLELGRGLRGGGDTGEDGAGGKPGQETVLSVHLGLPLAGGRHIR